MVYLVCAVNSDVYLGELVDVSKAEAGFDNEFFGLEAGGYEPALRVRPCNVSYDTDVIYAFPALRLSRFRGLTSALAASPCFNSASMQYGIVVPDPMPMILSSGLTYLWTAAYAASRFAASIRRAAASVVAGSGVLVTVDFETWAPAVNEDGLLAALFERLIELDMLVAGKANAAGCRRMKLMQAGQAVRVEQSGCWWRED